MCFDLLFVGLWDGLSGLITSPVKQTRDKGLWGLPTGIGQGLLGMVTKPIGGALELVNLTSQGILLQSGMVAVVNHKR